MTFISYAQNFEDIMLWRALKHIEKGFYIDVGANDPMIDSVTLAFYERGWRGINIEPMRQYYDRLCADRPEDINLPVAVADTKGELTLFDIPDTGLSTMDRTIAQAHIAAGREVIEHGIQVIPLSEICEKHVHGPIHFLKIDVEGLEGAVLRGMDFKKWRPWILVVEATLPQTQITNHAEWEKLVLDAGYRFSYFDGLNHYYVADDHVALMQAFKAPPNVFDDFFLRLGHVFSHPLTEFQIRTHDAELHAYQADLRTQRAHKQRDELKNELRHAEEKVQHALQAEALVRQRALQMEAELAAELAAVYASTSWRVTKPLRRLGHAKIVSKTWARLAVVSPRTFIKKIVLGLVRRIVPMIKRSPILISWALRLRNRFPAISERILNRIRPGLSTGPMNSMAPVALCDQPYVWNNDTSMPSPFKTMLSQELQQRQSKKRG